MVGVAAVVVVGSGVRVGVSVACHILASALAVPRIAFRAQQPGTQPPACGSVARARAGRTSEALCVECALAHLMRAGVELRVRVVTMMWGTGFEVRVRNSR